MKKRILNLFLIFVFLLTLSSCENMGSKVNRMFVRNKLNIGILLPEENSFQKETCLNSLKEICGEFRLKESRLNTATDVCEENVMDNISKLAQKGCNWIFVACEGLEKYINLSAEKYPGINFCYVYSSKEEMADSGNIHKYVFDESRSRYIAGKIAGYKFLDMKSNEMLQEGKVYAGYIAPFPEAESISAYTAFCLGMKSVYPDAELLVQYTFSERNAEDEIAAAKALISNGCVLIAQQSALNSSVNVCKENGVYFIGTEIFEKEELSDCYVTSVINDYKQAYREIINCILDEEMPEIIYGGCTKNTQFLTDINKNSFADVQIFEKALTDVYETKIAFENNELHVFDCRNWTVNGKKIKSTATEDLYEEYNGMEFISKDGYFLEYGISSFPEFVFIIDGITEMNVGMQ